MKYVHSLAFLGVRLADSPNGSFMVHYNFELCFMVEVKYKQHFDQPLMELKESVLCIINYTFSLRSMVS